MNFSWVAWGYQFAIPRSENLTGEPEPEPDNSLVDEYNREMNRLLDLEKLCAGCGK